MSTTTTGTRIFNFNGGTLAAAADSTTFLSLGSGSARANVRDGGAIINSNGKDITVGQALLHSDIAGDAATDGGLMKTGAGTLTLTGTSTYNGPTAVTNGTLTLSGSGSINGSSGITLGGGATLMQLSSAAITPAISVTAGTLDGTATAGAVTVGNGTGGSIANGNGAAVPLTLGSLTFQGAGTMNLRMDGTALGLVVTGALATAAANGKVTVNVTNAPSVWVTGTPYHLVQFGSFNGAVSDFTVGSVENLANGQNAVLGVDAANGYLTLTVTGGDTFYWTGAASAAWTTGTVAAPKNWARVTDDSAVDFVSGDLVVFDDRAIGHLTVDIAENVVPQSTIFNNATNTFVLASSGGYGITDGPIILNGTGTVVFATSQTTTDGTSVNNGTLQIGDGVSDVSLAGDVVNSACLAYHVVSAQTIGTVISGTGLLRKEGPGTLTVTSQNIYTGPTVVNQGVLQIGDGTTVGSLQTSSAITNNGTLVFNATGAEVFTNAIAGSGVVYKTGGSSLDLTGKGGTYGGNTFLGAGYLRLGGAGTAVSGALGIGTLYWNGGTVEAASGDGTVYNPIVVSNGLSVSLGVYYGALNLMGALSGNATISVYGNAGSYNSIRLGGDNSGFSGTFSTWGNTRGRMRISSASAGSANARWIHNSATADGIGLEFGTGTLAFGSLTGGGYIRNDTSGLSTLCVGALGLTNTFSGQLQDNGSCNIALLKVGEGRWTLSGSNSYDGGTVVSNGTLEVTGSTGGGATFVRTHAVLAGTGALNGSVTINAGATLAPGTSSVTGALSVASLTLESGAKLAYRLASTNVYDKVTVSGALSVSGLNFGDVQFATDAGLGLGSYVLIDAASVTGSLGTAVSGPLGVGRHGKLVLDAATGNLVLQVTPGGTVIYLF